MAGENDNKGANANNVGTAVADPKLDLQKSLDDSVAELNTLLKSKGEDGWKEDLKDKEKRKKIKEYMKKFGEEDDDDDEEPDDDEDDKGKKVKKSFTEDGLVDAVPVLGEIAEMFSSLQKSLSSFEKKFNELEGKYDEVVAIQKSQAKVTESEVNMMKSINGNIETILKSPLGIKGKIEGGESTISGPTISKAQIRDILIKSYQEKKLSYNDIAKWEQSGYNIGVMSKQAKQVLEAELKKGGLI